MRKVKRGLFQCRGRTYSLWGSDVVEDIRFWESTDSVWVDRGDGTFTLGSEVIQGSVLPWHRPCSADSGFRGSWCWWCCCQAGRSLSSLTLHSAVDWPRPCPPQRKEQYIDWKNFIWNHAILSFNTNQKWAAHWIVYLFSQLLSIIQGSWKNDVLRCCKT